LKCHRSQASFKTASFQHNLTSEQSCVSCHNAHAANGEHLLARSQVELCMGCHFNDVKSGEKASYITHDGLECVNCHLPHGSQDSQLLKTRDPQLCAGCHEAAHRVSHPMGPEVIDPRTGEEVTCLTCHQLHGAEFDKYLPLNPDMALCVQCHKK
jgi:predicted CXXCH cytochrome family protein